MLYESTKHADDLIFSKVCSADWSIQVNPANVPLTLSKSFQASFQLPKSQENKVFKKSLIYSFNPQIVLHTF